MSVERCSWCGERVEAGDGFRAYEPAGERSAIFCRLEHVVPWTLKGAHWDAGAEPPELDGDYRCSGCDKELDDVRIDLIRHRGEHRIADHFCGVDHLSAWAKAGGRWR
ncbi:MAG: hypothetical protein M3383_09030 [Actinomycetota bacterium]|nr:hypothetical protein [Actinomycetota bacterium]